MSNQSYFSFQEAGQEALRERRFRAAKGAFDKAFQTSKDSTVSASVLVVILDLLVETQIKLREFDGALKDARSMIRYARADPRGYLRCGQLSRLKKDLFKAQIWYERGLRNVPKTKDLYSRLETERSNIARKMGVGQQDKPQDPFVLLPMEIIHMISEHLNLRQATICLRVSTTWRNVLLAVPSIWRTMDLLSAPKNVKLSNMKACVQRLSAPPTTLRLDKLTVSAVTYLRPFIKRWTTIEHLSIDIPDLLDLGSTCTLAIVIKNLHLGPQCPVHFSVVDDILHHCDLLQYARFDAIRKPYQQIVPSPATAEACASMHRKTNLPALTHLVLNAVERSEREVEQAAGWVQPLAFWRDFPNLTTIKCRGFGFFRINLDLSTARCLRHLSLEDSYLIESLKLPSSLEVFICKYVSIPNQVQSLEALARLRVLELDGISRASSQASSRLIEILLKSPSATLTRLDLTDCVMEASDLMALLEAGKLSKLTFFRTSLPELRDSDMERIAAGCGWLEHMELCGSRITGVAVKSLCSFTPIKTLKLSNCLQISADAIHWARAKGVHVIVNQIDEGGRRLYHG